MMTEKDKKLIEKAWKINDAEWYMVGELTDQADTEEAREKLQSIQTHKYHMDEHHCGLG